MCQASRSQIYSLLDISLDDPPSYKETFLSWRRMLSLRSRTLQPLPLINTAPIYFQDTLDLHLIDHPSESEHRSVSNRGPCRNKQSWVAFGICIVESFNCCYSTIHYWTTLGILSLGKRSNRMYSLGDPFHGRFDGMILFTLDLCQLSCNPLSLLVECEIRACADVDLHTVDLEVSDKVHWTVELTLCDF